MPRSSCRTESIAAGIATAIRSGAVARVVRGLELRGTPLTYLEVDGQPVPVPECPVRSTARTADCRSADTGSIPVRGVRVEHGDWTGLYVTPTEDAAEALLSRALSLAASLGGPNLRTDRCSAGERP